MFSEVAGAEVPARSGALSVLFLVIGISAVLRRFAALIYTHRRRDPSGGNLRRSERIYIVANGDRSRCGVPLSSKNGRKFERRKPMDLILIILILVLLFGGGFGYSRWGYGGGIGIGGVLLIVLVVYLLVGHA